MRLLLLILVALAVVGILLATQDSNFVPVSLAIPFLGINLTGALFWMLAGWFGIGLVVGYLGTLPGRIGASMRARRAEKQLASAETTATTAISSAHKDAAAASAYARSADARAGAAAQDAAETQRLADEVARRTAASTSGRDVPPPRAI